MSNDDNAPQTHAKALHARARAAPNAWVAWNSDLVDMLLEV